MKKVYNYQTKCLLFASDTICIVYFGEFNLLGEFKQYFSKHFVDIQTFFFVLFCYMNITSHTPIPIVGEKVNYDARRKYQEKDIWELTKDRIG